MRLTIRRTLFSLVLMVASGTESIRAEGTNILVLDRLHDKYTVPEGTMAIACVRLIGAQSIEAFQKERLLSVDGVVGPKTWENLSETLQKKGIEIKHGADSPIALSITLGREEQICFEIHNRTTRHVLIQAGESLYQKGTGRRAFIPVSLKFSGENGGRRFSGIDVIILELNLPQHIEPHGSLKLFKSYRRVGKGATRFSASIVATENENKIFPVDGKPLLLKENIVFAD